MEAQGDPREARAHLRQYWRILWAGRYTALTTFVVIVTVGVVATFLQTPIYKSTATLEIHARAQKVAPVADVSQIGTTDYGWSAEDRYLKTQLEVLQSRAVAEKAFNMLGQDGTPFQKSEDPVAAFGKLLEIDPREETGIIDISMTGRDPERVTYWVNTYGQAYVDRNIEQARDNAKQAINELLERIEPLRKKLKDTQDRMFKYARDEKVYEPDVQKKSYDERLAQLEKDFTETRLHRLQLEAVFQKIEEISQSGGNYHVLPQVADDEVLRDLNKQRIDLETEQKRLLVTYKPGHFKVKEVTSELEKLEQKISNETDRIISAIRTDYSLTLDREKDLKNAIERAKVDALDVSEKASGYKMLETEANEAQRVYDLLTARIEEVNLNAELVSNNVLLLDRAVVPLHPYRPKKILNFALSILLGGALGVGLVFFLEYIDNTVRSAETVERDLGLKIMALVPTRRRHAESALNEAYHMLRMGVELAGRDVDKRVILVTSASPGEGKSSVSAALARALARGGDRVCLVDADLRRPSVHTTFGVPSAPGLTNFVSSGEAPGSYRGYLRDGDVEGMSILTCGPLPPNPPEIIATERFASLLTSLRADFDWVVLDSPPAVGLADSVLLSSAADMVLLVIRHASTDREIVRRALANIRRVKENVAGAVLNDVDVLKGEARSSYGTVYYPMPSPDQPEATATARRPAAL
ncbi:MAG TPA: polysaccharide biosynthesis tyrosine autokinase [Candidatus Saccharimonadales bacterium]|nr:polysaccharide biosynthesis tyrosine autokinase [Candidatus Saccharimonadales bacterium]